MNKKILTEINRYRELMGLKVITEAAAVNKTWEKILDALFDKKSEDEIEKYFRDNPGKFTVEGESLADKIATNSSKSNPRTTNEVLVEFFEKVESKSSVELEEMLSFLLKNPAFREVLESSAIKIGETIIDFSGKQFKLYDVIAKKWEFLQKKEMSKEISTVDKITEWTNFLDNLKTQFGIPDIIVDEYAEKVTSTDTNNYLNKHFKTGETIVVGGDLEKLLEEMWLKIQEEINKKNPLGILDQLIKYNRDPKIYNYFKDGKNIEDFDRLKNWLEGASKTSKGGYGFDFPAEIDKFAKLNGIDLSNLERVTTKLGCTVREQVTQSSVKTWTGFSLATQKSGDVVKKEKLGCYLAYVLGITVIGGLVYDLSDGKINIFEIFGVTKEVVNDGMSAAGEAIADGFDNSVYYNDIEDEDDRNELMSKIEEAAKRRSLQFSPTGYTINNQIQSSFYSDEKLGGAMVVRFIKSEMVMDAEGNETPTETLSDWYRVKDKPPIEFEIASSSYDKFKQWVDGVEENIKQKVDSLKTK